MKIELEGIEYTVTQKVISMDGATLILKRSEYSKRMIAEGLRATIDDCCNEMDRYNSEIDRYQEMVDRYQEMVDDKIHELKILEKKLEEIES